MKKKLLFLFFLFVLVIGIAYLISRSTSNSNSEEASTQKSYTANKEEITDIRIDISDRQIEVIPSADNQIHIDYSETSKESYLLSVSDDHVLTMTAVTKKDWTDYIGYKSASNSHKITLHLPSTPLETLELSTTNEDILLPTLTVAADLSLSSHGGNINFNKINAGNSIRLSAKNGDITGAILGSYNDYNISCKIKKGESNLPLNKPNGTKTLEASNNNGDINIEFVNE